MGGGLDDTAVLVCRAGGLLCALPLSHVRETMRPLPIEPLSGVPAAVCGVTVIRGQPAPVLDARVLLGGAAPCAPTRFVSLAIGGRTVAVAVDATLGVRTLAADTLEPLPPLLANAADGVVASIATCDRAMLLVLGTVRIVPDAVWASVEGRG